MGIEDLLLTYAEKGIVGGAFLFLLHFLVQRVIKQLESISNSLLAVSQTMVNIDNRIVSIEKRLDKLEEKDVA